MSDFIQTPSPSTPSLVKPAYSMAGLAYVPMPLGAIRIGHSINLPGGELMLVRDDEFKITQPLRQEDGSWLADPLNETLRQRDGAEGQSNAQRKLLEIPIRIHVNDPSLVVRARLEAFDIASRRTVCASNGTGVAKRASGAGGTVDVECVGCDRCSFANSGAVACKFFGRIAVQIEGQKGEIGTYVLRTSSYNTIKTFESKLFEFWAALGQRIRGVPFMMRLRAAQTELSNWNTFYFVDLELNDVTLADAARKGRDQAREDEENGLDIGALQETMLAGLRNGGYLADSAEDGVDLNEFIAASKFAATMQATQSGPSAGATVTMGGRDVTKAEGATQVDPSTSSVSTQTFNVLPAFETVDSAERAPTGIYVRDFGTSVKRKPKASINVAAPGATMRTDVETKKECVKASIAVSVQPGATELFPKGQVPMSAALKDLMS